jgi:hypothetical protein
MDSSTWILIAAITVAVVIVIVVIAVAMRRRNAPARREMLRTEAREQRREAELKAAEADRMEAEARMKAAQAEQKSAAADMTKAEARQEAVLAADDHHQAEAVAREAAETRSQADRIDPDVGKGQTTERRDTDRWDDRPHEVAEDDRDARQPAEDTPATEEGHTAGERTPADVRPAGDGTAGVRPAEERREDVPVGTRRDETGAEGNEV